MFYRIIKSEILLTLLASLLLFACSESGGGVDPIDNPDPGNGDSSLNDTKILFIGNSYTYFEDMPGIFREIATDLGKDVYVDQSVAGGKQVPYFVNDTTTHAKIAAVEWDYVVFQMFQLIMESEDRLWTHLPKAIAMDSIIHHYQPNAKTIVFMEQAYARGDETYDPNDTFQAMTDRVKSGSLSFARQMGTNPIIAPVAVAWGEVYKFDNEYPLHHPDGAHPSAYGAYITASTFYSTIFKERVTSTFINDINSEWAVNARRIASDVVLDSLALWNNE